MHVFRLRNGLTALAVGALFLPGFARAQEVEVISKEISVGRQEAALLLELSNHELLEISLRDQLVTIDGEEEGFYRTGDELDTAWRALLGQAVTLEDGPLSEMLVAWSPPESLRGESRDLAEAIDEALETAFSVPVRESRLEEPEIHFSFGDDDGASLLRVLLSQANRLGVLEGALGDLEEGFHVYIEEDVDIDEGETLDGALVSIQGDVRIEGTVDGDVVVVDGTLELLPGSRVRGEVSLVEARMVRNEGTVDGEVVDVLRDTRVREDEIRDRVREELRAEIRANARPRFEYESGRRSFNPLATAFTGVAGVFKDLVAVLILGLIGMGVVAFAGENLETVAETARRSPGRAAMVGVAGSFLLVPVWILGVVALAVSIVGIPVMIAWLPLFPLAALAAGVLGYLAVARNTGEWLADSNYRFTDWIRKSNPVYTIAGGLVGLMAFFIAANVLSIVPFFGFFKGLLSFAGIMVTLVAIQIGFGAVLLTRGGRRPEYYANDDLDAAWEAAMEVEVEEIEVEGDEAPKKGAKGEAKPDA